MSNVTDLETLGGAGSPRGRSGRRAALIIIAVVAVIALVVAGGSIAYAKQYDGKALPGTTVLGQDVAGKSVEEIAALVGDQASKVTVTVNTDGQPHEAKLADLGVAVDAQTTARNAVEHDGDITEVISSTFSGKRTVTPVVSVDPQAISAYATSLVPDDRTAAADAQVVYDADAKTWNVVPGHAGLGVDPSILEAAVTEKAPSLENFSVDQPIQQTPPAISDEAAQSTLDTITATLDQPVSIKGPDGTVYEASKDRRSGWLSVSPNEANDGLDVHVDDAAVKEWVDGRAEKASVEPTKGIEQIDANGAVTKVVSEKKDGVKVSNSESITQQIVAGVQGGSPVEVTFETTPVPAEVTQAKAPDAATPADPATPAADPTGEKWIDINLSDKTLTAYQGDTPVFGPKKIVDGKKDYETVTGTFEIYHRLEKQDMTNASKFPQSDSRYYYTKDVPWVQYFKGGYAIHGAPWRSSFGYSGSHGCINMSVSDAKWMYDWASMGTKVVVHY